MCLEKITKRYDPPLGKTIAYKMLTTRADGTLMTPYRQQFITIGSEYDAIVEDIYSYGDRTYYKSGFHVYKTLEDAQKVRKWDIDDPDFYNDEKIYKVEVWNVTYEGIDGSSSSDSFQELQIKNLVALNMRVLEEVKEDATV